MGPDLEINDRLGSMESLDSKENKKSLEEPGEKNMCCVSYQADIFELETSKLKQAEQVKQLEKSKEETENSSSFGKTFSGDENDDILSDSEVMSKLRDNEFGKEYQMRKKELTSHWKTFRQPYMWRCRWGELKMRQLRYQASKYDLQAEAIRRRKQLILKNSTVEDNVAKSLPFSGTTRKGAVIQRKKRKRVEDLTDTAAYMAQHPLFSYHGLKKCGADVLSSLHQRENIGIPTNKRFQGNSVFGCIDEPVSLEFRNDDNSLEQILWKIGVLQSHLGELKTRFIKVHDENVKDIHSAYAMNSNDVSTTTAQRDFCTNEREKLGQVSTVDNRCDMRMTKTAISTHEEDTNLIGINESKDQLQNGISCEKEGDAHLIHNSTATELNNTEKVEVQPTEKVEIQPTEKVEIQSTENVEIQPTEKVDIHPTEKPETSKGEEKANIVQSVPVPVVSISEDQPEIPKEEQENTSLPVQEMSIADDEPSLKKRCISGLTSPHNTRNRGRGRGRGRRRRGSRWSRRA
ncbi:uncharacterized protein LOC141693339 isoform X2 [Apium graveolens]|uniref:uncharacterized protein LOC141693339 isoform X2 n=1 Tax=Apium graveolens TaxID=4045 RepID=UPI003D79E277